ncbi:MAG TPA: porin family protein, partial [Flavobacterium sp.]|nr:porin family protein [Flavobacterium sp.]
NFKPGLQIGGTVEIPLTFYKKVSVQAELQYAVQGYKGKEYDQIDMETKEVIETLKLEDVTMHYLYLPITFKYYVNTNFSVELGGQIGYMLDAKGQFDANKYNPAREYLFMADPQYQQTFSQLDKALFESGYRNTDPDNYYEKMDYGVTAGFSYYMESGLYFNFRYYLGLQDVYKIDNSYINIPEPERMPGMSAETYELLLQEVRYVNEHLNFDPLKNSSIQISVGYKF